MRKGIFPGMEHLMMPWIGKTMKHIDLFISGKLSEKGIDLSRQQMVLMKILLHDGPLPQNDLAFLTDRDKASLTRLLKTMERKNLVARISSADDKRVNMVHLTKHGEKTLSELMPVFLEVVMQMQSDISEEEQKVVIRVMQKIQDNISNNSNSCTSNNK
jgi:DNA-binding MarR family transcriptional regulator